MCESDTLLHLADFAAAEEAALRGLHAARRAGLVGWFPVTILVANAAEAILFAGRTADAAALIDPLTTGPPRGDDWLPSFCGPSSTCSAATCRRPPAGNGRSRRPARPQLSRTTVKPRS